MVVSMFPLQDNAPCLRSERHYRFRPSPRGKQAAADDGRRLEAMAWLATEAEQRLREQYPRWGKDKLVVLLRQEGYQISSSMLGRILPRTSSALTSIRWRRVAEAADFADHGKSRACHL